QQQQERQAGNEEAGHGRNYTRGQSLAHAAKAPIRRLKGGTRILRVISRAGRPCHFFKLSHVDYSVVS
ncbi:MAG TPA: hypothetical protein VGC60_07500, partial [Pyrinomonadaceae bacterium]